MKLSAPLIAGVFLSWAALAQQQAPGGGGTAGTSSTFTATGSSSSSSTTGLFSAGTLSYPETGLLGSFQTSVNSFAQIDVQNTSNGTTASADFIVANDQGTATTHYGNFGINSSGFAGTGSLNLPGASYLTATTGELVLGTTTLNGIHFVVNSGTTDAGAFSTGGVLSLASSPIFTGQTGYAYANGSSALTYSTTIPAASVSGLSGTYAPLVAPSFTTPTLGVASATTINKWTLTAPATGITLTGTDNQAYTLPTTSATLARTDAAQTFTGNQTINNALILATAGSINTNSGTIGKGTAPTACTVAGVTVCTVTKHVGSFAVKYTLTTGTPAGSTVTLAEGAATNGYICDGVDITSNLRLQETTDSTTAPVLTAYNLAGAATFFTAGDALLIKCISY